MMSVFGRQSMQQRGGVAQNILSDLGPGMHPRISIRGGQFGLIDAAGMRYGAPVILQNTPQGQKVTLRAIIIGSNPVKSRIYFEDDYDPDSPSPPDCFSDNGQAPSSNASSPQARTCAECEWQKWGSDMSKLTGKKTKACAEKKKLGVLIVGDTTKQVYELQVPPATLKNMAKYVGTIAAYTPPGESRKADVADFVTAISFETGQTGILEFAPHSWISSAYLADNGALEIAYDPQNRPLDAQDGGASTAGIIDAIWDSDELDEILGLNDKPWAVPALTGPLPGMAGYLAAPQQGQQPQHQPQPQPQQTATQLLAGQFTPSNPYQPPAGAAPAAAAPLGGHGRPAAALAQPEGQQQAPAPKTRKPRATAVAQQTTAALPAPNNVVPGPGAAAPQSGGDIPPFLRRAHQEQGPAASGHAQQNGGSPTFAPAGGGAPTGAVQDAVNAAFNLPTSRT